MADSWLSRLRALLAEIELNHTVPRPPATGCDAQPADVSVSPTEPENGFQASSPNPQKIPETEPDMRDVLQAKTARALHDAVELHCRAMHGSGILTNFVVVAETVDANLDNETDKRSLQLLTSADMTAWTLVGFSAALSQAVYSGTI